MRNRIEQILSILLIFSMLCTLTPTPAFALQSEVQNSEEKNMQTITLSAMGKEENAIDTANLELPPAPSDLQITERTTTTLTLSWVAGTNNMGIGGYNIYVGDTLLAETSGESTQYTLTGLKQGTEYTLTVKTRDLEGNESAIGAVNTASTVGLSVTAQVEQVYIVDRYRGLMGIPITVVVESDDPSYKVSVSSLYSAIYLVIPLLMPPVDKERAMVAKLLSCPTNATPAGPIIPATTFTPTRPVSIRTNVDIAVKENTFTMSSLVARRNN